MTPAEKAQIAKARRQAAQLEPKLARAYLRSLERLKKQKGEITDEDINRAFEEYRKALQDAIVASTKSGALPPWLAKLAPNVSFNYLNPKVIEAIKQLDDRMMRTLADGIRETVRTQVQAGIELGLNPRQVARALDIELAPNQALAVQHYREALEAGNAAKALTYKLRDARFDASTLKGGLSAEKIDKMVAAYRRRMVAFNADTNARTAALDAQRMGQYAAMQDAVDKGAVDAAILYKRWQTVGDDRVREEHQEMQGEIAKWDQPYSNGETVPGESTYNCRCQSIYFEEPNPNRVAMANEAQREYRKRLAEEQEAKKAA